MSYTPENEKIDPSVEKMLEGIKEFGECADRKLESGLWSSAHIREVFDIKKDLIDLQLRLHALL